MGLTSILAIVNALAPEIVNVIVAIKNNSGGTSALVYLNEADTDFAANQAQVTQWLAAHNLTPSTPAVPPAT